MFIYADESGHTGRKIFNPPTLYRLGAILHLADVEEALKSALEPLNKAAGRKRLHATELGAAGVAEILPSILDVLDKAGKWAFLFGEIEKDYVATTKFVDLLFDPVENEAVPPLWYNHRGFRHVLCLTMDHALGEHRRKVFWDAFLDDDMDRIGEVIRGVGHFVRMRENDQRLREIVRDATQYALRHPQDFTLTAAKGKKAYQGHTPNLVGFSFIFDAIHRFHDKTGSKPIAFIHDQQKEFGESMKEWAEIFGRVKKEEHKGLATASIVDYDLPKLATPSSADVYALQAADLLLWSMTRADDVLRPHTERLADKIDPYAISREISGNIVSEFQAMMSYPLSEREVQAAEQLRSGWEEARLEKIRQRRIAAKAD